MVECSDIIDGIKIVEPVRHEDERGTFIESYNQSTLREIGLRDTFVQDNHVCSRNAGTLRGLHFQKPPFAQAKLIRCTAGRILDVAVDIRSGSNTFCQHFAVELSAEIGNQLYVPVGFAHGYCTLEPNCEVQYKVSEYYAPEAEAGIAPLDPALGINWGAARYILSQKDRELPLLSELETPFIAVD